VKNVEEFHCLSKGTSWKSYGIFLSEIVGTHLVKPPSLKKWNLACVLIETGALSGVWWLKNITRNWKKIIYNF
jgi:hypothetical protein